MSTEHYTSIEMSKRLLELGLKAESADACYDVGYGQTKAHIECENFISYFTNDEYPELKDRFVPCWSIGALLNIIPNYQLQTQVNGKIGILFGCKNELKIIEADTVIDTVFQMVVWLLENSYIKTE